MLYHGKVDPADVLREAVALEVRFTRAKKDFTKDQLIALHRDLVALTGKIFRCIIRQPFSHYIGPR